MYSHYGISSPANLPIKRLTRLLKSSQERIKEVELREMWLAFLSSPYFDSETAGTFEKFKQNHIAGGIAGGRYYSTEEIEKEMSWVVAEYERQKAGKINGTV